MQTDWKGPSRSTSTPDTLRAWVMPNGKKLRDCSADEVAAMVAPNPNVGGSPSTMPIGMVAILNFPYDTRFNPEKLVVDRLRKRAKSKGLRLMKSRCRTPDDPSYGGYMLVDDRNIVVEGARQNAYDATLAMVADYLEHHA